MLTGVADGPQPKEKLKKMMRREVEEEEEEDEKLK